MKRVLLIANYNKHVGGISAQVTLLCNLLNNSQQISDVSMSEVNPYHADIFSTKGSPVKRVWLFVKLLWKVKRYEVLHIHGCSDWGMLPVVFGVIAGKIWRKKIIVTYHGGGANNYFERHGEFARRWLCRADKVIVLNGYLDKVFHEYKIPRIVIPNVVPLREDAYLPKKSITPKMISVRHLTDLYRIDVVIHAFAKVVEIYPEATLDILGQGDKRGVLEQLVASDNRLTGRVRFIGQVPNEKMSDYLKANDIMLSAPRIDNMPVSLMEAMNAGVLVISSRVGGVPYMIEDGKTGLLFEGDADALAEKIIYALEHQEASVKMIETAHEEVKKYSWNNVRKQLLPLYESI